MAMAAGAVVKTSPRPKDFSVGTIEALFVIARRHGGGEGRASARALPVSECASSLASTQSAFLGTITRSFRA